MFRCGLCSKKSKNGEKAVRVVLDTRPKTYPGVRQYLEDDEGAVLEDPVGWEIVSETLAHTDCADTFCAQKETR